MSAADSPDYTPILRHERPQVVATLNRLVNNLDDAEDAFAEATIEALKRWPTTGIPTRPGAWLTTVARRKALDALRRATRRTQREEAVMTLLDDDSPLDYQTIRDDQLRLLFICCHPALPISAQVRLALRLLGGLTTAEIAHAFLEPEGTTSKRITRAKAKIAANNIAYRIPADHELPERIHGVLNVVARIYTTGHHAPYGHSITRTDLTAEALRLADVVSQLMPDEPECLGLRALLLATDARTNTRVDSDGHFTPLVDADRSQWNVNQAHDARVMLEQALRHGTPGPFQLQAAVSCLHSLASSYDETDWRQISELYQHLERLTPSVPVKVNRAIATAQHEGPMAGLAILQQVADAADTWHFFHVAVGHLHAQIGNTSEAITAYHTAMDRAQNDADRQHIRRHIATVGHNI
jgi:RNA polymerase sigma-70 factor, ECF subfamily